MNFMKDNNTPFLKYFDKRVAEEDTPIKVTDEAQQKYEQLDILFEEFFDDNSLHLAKVDMYLIISNHRKKKETKRD